jgi:pimeloyl-ACP methyl ester carboxylesterase
MKEEKVIFYNKKNQKIVGLLSLPEKKNLPLVIIIHGFVGSKEYYPFVNNTIKPLTDAGFAALRIDCRGSGESDLEFKDVTIETEAEDILTTMDYVKTLDFIDSTKIALIGISFGCAAILSALKNNPKVRTLIFWNPVMNFKNDRYIDAEKHRKTIAKEGVFYVRQSFTGKVHVASSIVFNEMMNFNVKDYSNFVNMPVLIIRGLNDTKDRIEKDKNIVSLLNAKYDVIENADHNFRGQDPQEKLNSLTINWLIHEFQDT